MAENQILQLLRSYTEKRCQLEERLRAEEEEGFNLFWALKVDSKELNHSAFIHALISKSKYGNAMSQLLLEQIQLRMDKPLAATPQDEAHPSLDGDAQAAAMPLIGPHLGSIARHAKYGGLKVTDAYVEYAVGDLGRIDILVKATIPAGRLAIVIENKIYAADQHQQLHRYYEAMKQEGYADEEIVLVYLNLWGNPPSEESTLGLAPEIASHIVQLSYAEDINTWLKNCLEHLKLPPRLADSIAQYQEVIRDMTQGYKENEVVSQTVDKIIHESTSGNSALLSSLLQMKDVIALTKARLMRELWDDIDALAKARLKELKSLPEYSDPMFVLKSQNHSYIEVEELAYAYSTGKGIYSALNFDLKHRDDGSMVGFRIEFLDHMYYGPALYVDGAQVAGTHITLNKKFRKCLDALGYCNAKQTDKFIDYIFVHYDAATDQEGNPEVGPWPNFRTMDEELSLLLATPYRRRQLARAIVERVMHDIEYMLRVPKWVDDYYF